MKDTKNENLDRDIKELRKLYRSIKPKNGEQCVYCGFYATDREHVTPQAYLRLQKMAATGSEIDIPKEIIVPACRECNLIASDRVFKSFDEKKRFICERIIEKYRKFDKYELWEDDEIEELGGRLKEQVFIFNEVAKIMKRRFKRLQQKYDAESAK